jgi:hypothetical protein
MGTTKRPDADSPRERFLYTDLTQEEYKKILRYCREKHITMSKFFADLLLKEVSKPQSAPQETVTVKIDLTAAQHEKLELLTRLHHKESVGDYVRDILEPEFRLQRLHTRGKTKLVRYYLSDDEYEKIMKYMNASGLSVRNHPAILALRAIQKPKKPK